MAGLVESIAKALVSRPADVVVTEEDHGNEIVIKLSVAKEDMGKIIGKQGRIAKAIRTVVKAAAIKQNKRVTVDIVEEQRDSDNYHYQGMRGSRMLISIIKNYKCEVCVQCGVRRYLCLLQMTGLW